MTRSKVSNGLAAVGVALFLTAGVFASGWRAAGLFFAGLVLMAVSEALTPCQDQMTKWWRNVIGKTRNQP